MNHYLERVYSPDRILHPLKRVGTQGRGPVRAHLLGRGAGPRSRTASARSPPSTAPRPSCPTRTRATWACSPTGAWTAASSTSWGPAGSTAPSAPAPGSTGCETTLGKAHGLRPRGRRARAVHRGLGRQHRQLQRAPLAVHRGGAAPRGDAGDHRPLPLAHGREVGPAPRPHAGHGRRAGPRPHARRSSATASRTATTSSATRSARTQLRARVRGVDAGARGAETTGLAAADVEWLAREYATRQPSAIRLNYGLNRHAGAGMAVRAIACLPAVTGAWRHPGGGVLLSSLGHVPRQHAALERPDLVPPGTRTPQHEPDRPHPARPVAGPAGEGGLRLQLEPAGGGAGERAGARGASRARTSSPSCTTSSRPTPSTTRTSCCPRTTTLEHYDLHKSYGHLYLSLNRPAIAPLGESQGEHRGLPAAGRAHGPRRSRPARHATRTWRGRRCAGSTRTCAGISFEDLEREGTVRLERARPVRALRGGRVPDAVGQVRAVLRARGAGGARPRARLRPAAREPAHGARARAPLPARLHLAARAPLPELDLLRAADAHAARERADRVRPPATTRSARGIADGAMVRVFNDRGVVRGPGARCRTPRGRAWPWACRSGGRSSRPGGRNANAVTSQELTDMGGGATFYDCLVEVEVAPP